MYEKKKVTIILVVSIVLIVGMLVALRMPIIHTPIDEIWISFKTADGITRVQLSDDEARTVRKLLNGKTYDLNLYFVNGSACGYGPNRTIEIGGTLYYVSQDSCGVVQKAGTRYYYDLTNQEWDTIWAIFVAHGAKYI